MCPFSKPWRISTGAGTPSTDRPDTGRAEASTPGCWRLAEAAGAGAVGGGPPVALPPPGALELEQVMLPRTAFFGPAEQVPASQAVGRIAAEMVSPYPPGVPAVAPGELITAEVLDYLRSGAAAGLLVPDAADPSMESLRVVAA